MLALALILSEQELGFNIRSFGIIAGILIIILIGIIFFKIIQALTGTKIASGAVAFILIYFLTQAITPGLFSWLAKYVPIIHLLLGITVIICLWYLVSLFFSKPGSFKRTKKDNKKRKKEFTAQEDVVKNRLKKTTKQQRKKSKEITGGIKGIISIIKKHGDTAYGRKLITQKLRQDILPKEHDVADKLAYLKKIDAWLKNFDLKQFEALRKKYNSSSKQKKSLIKKQILEQREKINIEEQIKNLDFELNKYRQSCEYSINMAYNHIREGKTKEANECLYKAIEVEKKAAGLLKKMKKLEDVILGLTKIEVKQESQMELF